MRNLIIYFCLGLFSFQILKAQDKVEKKPAKKEQSTENFMDLQSETLTSIFGSNLDGNSDGKTLSFLELLEKTDLPEEQKKEYRQWYYLQSKKLTQKQKDSLANALDKKMKKAAASQDN